MNFIKSTFITDDWKVFLALVYYCLFSAIYWYINHYLHAKEELDYKHINTLMKSDMPVDEWNKFLEYRKDIGERKIDNHMGIWSSLISFLIILVMLTIPFTQEQKWFIWSFCLIVGAMINASFIAWVLRDRESLSVMAYYTINAIVISCIFAFDFKYINESEIFRNKMFAVATLLSCLTLVTTSGINQLDLNNGKIGAKYLRKYPRKFIVKEHDLLKELFIYISCIITQVASYKRNEVRKK
ncbi:MAG: hypothetical protein HC939_22420 [Pleurocapsa sp. SU_5_0]|nr:hypothetical protein [Pleurocapsa sp. SU_5_0]